MHENILITGASGMLGKELVRAFGDKKLLTPTRQEMDIKDKEQVSEYFNKNKIDAIIHCAAIAKVKQADSDPQLAIQTNIAGTANLAGEAIKRGIRFLYISTDYVYPCTKGNYSETDLTMPFTLYGWTKLGGECAVKTLPNHCIIRTSFFDPKGITFPDAPVDAYSSKIPVLELANEIIKILETDFKGTINLGQEKISMHDLYKKYNPEIKKTSIKDLPAQRAPDSSMNIDLWKKLTESKEAKV